MKITRAVILDLLPLYVSDEASRDTANLVEEYLATDPELSEIARETAAKKMIQETPVTLSKEDKMEAYKEAKKSMFNKMVILASIISAGILSLTALGILLAFFLIGRI